MKVIDLHCDTLSELRHGLYRGEKIDLGSNHLQVDLEKLKKGIICCSALPCLSIWEIPITLWSRL